MSHSFSRRPLSNITNIIPTNEKIDKGANKSRSKQKEKFIPAIEMRFGNPLDPQEVYDYQKEIYTNLKEEEKLYLVKENFLNFQENITPHDRSILINWMQTVHYKLELSDETLFMAVSIVDRYLSSKKIQLENIQLLGSAAIYISVKMEEVYFIPSENLVFYSANSFNQDDLWNMERDALNEIGFKINVPTVWIFIQRYNSLLSSNTEGINLSSYLTKISLLLHDAVELLPSVLAASIIYLSRLILGISPKWPFRLRVYSRCSEKRVKTFAETLYHQLFENEDLSKSFIKRKFNGKLKIRIPKTLTF